MVRYRRSADFREKIEENNVGDLCVDERKRVLLLVGISLLLLKRKLVLVGRRLLLVGRRFIFFFLISRLRLLVRESSCSGR